MDAVQEAFLYLHRKGRGLRLTARFTTFLYPVVRHESQRQMRRARRGNPVSIDTAAPRVLWDQRDEIGEDVLEHLARALAALPDTQREVVLMATADGMTHGEIAVALQIPLGTVKSRLHAAMKALRSDARLASFFD